jgi:hypothetical protein
VPEKYLARAGKMPVLQEMDLQKWDAPVLWKKGKRPYC